MWMFSRLLPPVLMALDPEGINTAGIACPRLLLLCRAAGTAAGRQAFFGKYSGDLTIKGSLLLIVRVSTAEIDR